MTSACAAFRDGLPGYLADALPPSERVSFRAHLTGCAECREAALSQEPALLFATLPPASVSEEDSRAVLEGVRAAIALRIASQKIQGRGTASRSRRLMAGGAAAACLVAAAYLAPSLRQRKAPRPAANVLLPASRPELVTPASATVYEWNPEAAGTSEPKIVWIVDRSFDI
jgi:hypothetical protein